MEQRTLEQQPPKIKPVTVMVASNAGPSSEIRLFALTLSLEPLVFGMLASDDFTLTAMLLCEIEWDVIWIVCGAR